MFSFLNQILYIQVSPELLTVRNPKTGAFISEIPEVAIAQQPKPKIVGVGKEARSHLFSPSVIILNPFASPRSLVSDFAVGVQLMKAFMRRILDNSFLATAPKIVLHLQGEFEGDLSQTEIRGFKEMLIGAGARQIVIWQGRNLGDQELLSGQFSGSGKVLS